MHLKPGSEVLRRFVLSALHHALSLDTSWVVTSNRGVLAALLLAAVAIGIAYASLTLYDEPIRRWLSERLLTSPAEPAIPDPGEK
jgi:peptidoglycan/LPS O-acetylase OafA/YrhL